jgi:hypothetical protein
MARFLAETRWESSCLLSLIPKQQTYALCFRVIPRLRVNNFMNHPKGWLQTRIHRDSLFVEPQSLTR